MPEREIKRMRETIEKNNELLRRLNVRIAEVDAHLTSSKERGRVLRDSAKAEDEEKTKADE